MQPFGRAIPSGAHGWGVGVILFWAAGTAACSQQQPVAADQQSEIPAVEVMIPAPSDPLGEVSGAGTIAYDQEIALSFPIAGIVRSIAVEEGAFVSAGQLVATIQPDIADADLRAAKAEASRAGAARRRIEALGRKGFATRAQLEAVQSAEAAAVARTEQARFAVRNTVLRAPRAGQILSRLAEVGQVAPAGTPLLRMGASAQGLVARIAFPADAVIVAGTMVSVWLGPQGRTAPRLMPVRRVLPLRNAATGTVEVEVAVPAAANASPGLLVRARARLAGRKAPILIPLTALVDGRTDQASLYSVNSANRIVRMDVTFDGLRGNAIAVTGGLQGDERVVTSGVPYVRPGQLVRVKPVQARP